MNQFGRRFHQSWVFTNNPWENVLSFFLQNSSHSFLDSEFTHKILLFIVQKITIIHFDGTIVAGMWNMLTLYILFHRGHTTPCHRGVLGCQYVSILARYFINICPLFGIETFQPLFGTIYYVDCIF